MSRSFRTQKESVTASFRAARDKDGNILLPAVVEREPARGDFHPVSKQMLLCLLPKLPVEYLYGLSRIELRARRPPSIGTPFGSYWTDERMIVLYSLPSVWYFKSLPAAFRASLEKFHALIEPHGDVLRISWPDDDTLSLWFYCDVFVHELGHHFVEQYRHKSGRIVSLKHEEFIADLHARRFTDELFAQHNRGRPDLSK